LVLEQAHGNDLSFNERLGLMLDREIALRTDRRLTNRLATAKLRFANASIEDIDFSAHRAWIAETSCLWHRVHGSMQMKT